MVKDNRPSVVKKAIRKGSKWHFIDSDVRDYVVDAARKRWKSSQFARGNTCKTVIVKKNDNGKKYFVAKGLVTGKRKK